MRFLLLFLFNVGSARRRLLFCVVAVSFVVATVAAPASSAGGPSLDAVAHDAVIPAATLFALAALLFSLLLAFRRQSLPAVPGVVSTQNPELPTLPERLREVRLFRLRYGVTLETGRLEAAGRSARGRSLRTAAGRPVSWRTAAGAADPEPTHVLTAAVAGGRVIASFNHATGGGVAVHEADLEMLHGLGRRGPGVILLPLVLATSAFAAVTYAALKDVLPGNAAPSAQGLWLSVIVAAALFAFTLLAAMAVCIGVTSAVLRRVRRAQFSRLYEPDLCAVLAGGAAAAGTVDAPGARPPAS